MKGIFIWVTLILLSGCTQTVYVDRVQYLYPEDSWMVPVQSAKPPARITFEKLVLEKRIAMIGESYIEQTANLTKCNAKLDSIAEWKAASLLKK